MLAWPWEALRDPQTDSTLAHHCRMERQLSGQHDPLDLPATLPRDRINILLITARPYDADVGFLALSRPLLDLIAQDNLPVSVEMLRPPTFDQLRTHLHARPGYYHIVHFDGHGGYGPGVAPDGYRMEGAQGRLLFETETDTADPVSADQLSALLREYRIPTMILNACQSAMIDAAATNAFASVAAALQRAGVRIVVAMAYSLYVSGARVFLPAFYRRLFEQGSITEAVRAGRQAMLHQQGRICYRGEFPLQDWLVPVVYQQDPPDLPFTGRAAASAPARERVALPPEVAQDTTPYGFIGRDSAVLALERAMRHPPAGILIHGLGGIGKTTLARGFVQWLADTGGLHTPPFWFTFNDIHSSEHVINQMVAGLFGTATMAADMAQKQAALIQALLKQSYLIVWDNFESVSGIPGTKVHPLLPEPDRQQLRDFLYALRGGKTKIIITSHSPETAWIDRAHCYRLPLGGLQGEERWTYCDAIVRDLGLTANRNDPHLTELMDFLDGHPLAMRAMLTQLADHSAADLFDLLRHRLQQAATDDAQAKLFATLGFVEEALPEALKPLLVPLALHERFVEANYLEAMAQLADTPHGRAAIDQTLTILEITGLLHTHSQDFYALHPALTGFLRARTSASDATDTAWRRAFVEVMTQLAQQIMLETPHFMRPFFALHNANVWTAATAAKHMGMDYYYVALAEALAFYAQEQRDFAQAQQWCFQILPICEKLGEGQSAASVYHTLGIIAQKQRDFTQAEQRYHQALVISEKLGNEQGAAGAYHQLGYIAREQRDFAQAEQWYRKSLTVTEKLGDEYGTAGIYHQLGLIAGEQGAFAQAGQWLIRSIIICLRYNDDYHLQMAAQNFLRCYSQAPPAIQATLKALWGDAGLAPLPAENAQE